MQSKSIWKIIRFSALLFFIAFLTDINAEVLKPMNGQLRVPPLMESIQFKNSIQFCGIKIPLNQQDVKQRLEKEMLLALWDRPQVILWIKRASKFFPHIEKILYAHDLPLDFKFVPLIESALKPHAKSAKNAVGYWQFLKSTGKQYGLKINATVDERKNIFKSTTAACKYLKDLKNEFNSYLLALAAYNMGEYGLKKEIKAQGTDDFFSLYLPLQTQSYIFKIICAKLILENQKLYGFSLNPSDLYPLFAFDEVNLTTDFKIPIALVAKAADIPFKTIKDFNPDLRGYYLKKGKQTILIPKGKAKGFKDKFTTAYNRWEKNIRPKFHVVKKAESLIGISNKYQLSLSLLLKLNGLTINSVIHPGDRLVVE